MVFIAKISKFRKGLIFLLTLLLVLCIIFAVIYIKMQPVIIKYAVSQAETVLLDCSNDATVGILKNNGTEYGDIVNLSYDKSGYITGLQIDIVSINLLKSLLSNEISSLVAEREIYEIAIPVGTFFGNEFISGIGPKIKFNFQLNSTSVVDFEHEFISAGINQVLHKIIINIETKGTLIVAGSKENFSVKTSAIAAQTVIVGATPDAFTEVVEEAGADTAGIINDYGAY